MARTKQKAYKQKAYRGECSEAPQSRPQLTLYSDIEINQNSPHVCAICDEGGDLIVCDGPCHRHFHKSVSCPLGQQWRCPTISLPEDHIGEWLCTDCKNEEHSCFRCHVSGKINQVVRKCPDPLCARFYCGQCLEPSVASCGLHACQTCGQGHNDGANGFLVQCMRCPKAWHKECLQFIQQRGFAQDRTIWDHSAHGQPEKGMFYCPDHAIDPTLGTPARTHISWI